jgi:hypothetical protein
MKNEQEEQECATKGGVEQDWAAEQVMKVVMGKNYEFEEHIDEHVGECHSQQH